MPALEIQYAPPSLARLPRAVVPNTDTSTEPPPWMAPPLPGLVPAVLPSKVPPVTWVEPLTVSMAPPARCERLPVKAESVTSSVAPFGLRIAPPEPEVPSARLSVKVASLMLTVPPFV